MQRKVKAQVFISSTYKDLQEERWAVLRSLLSMDCIVSGMELFPAIDMEQFAYIKQIIDDCDYYVLILGGRYGSESPEGLSYTEMEYDYACSKGIPVIALIYKDPDSLSPDKRETDPSALQKFNSFRDRVTRNRLVKFWDCMTDLQICAIKGLHFAKDNFPAVGWVRGNTLASEDVLTDLNMLRKENESLKNELSRFEKKFAPVIKGIAPLDEQHNFKYHTPGLDILSTLSISWKALFVGVFNSFRDSVDKHGLEYAMYQAHLPQAGDHWHRPHILDEEIDLIINQFLSHNLIQRLSVATEDRGTEVTYVLTEAGTRYGLAELAIKNNAAHN